MHVFDNIYTHRITLVYNLVYNKHKGSNHLSITNVILLEITAIIIYSSAHMKK